MVDGFFDAIRSHVGDAPVECNGHLRQRQIVRAGLAQGEMPSAWFRCLEMARANRKSAILVLAQPSVDSWTLTGSLGLQDGRVEAFSYEAYWGASSGRLHYGDCTSPSVRLELTGPFGVHCRNERDNVGRVSMVERSPMIADRDLLRRLPELTDRSAVDCGRHVFVSFDPALEARALRASLECAVDAKRRGNAFRVIDQYPTMASWTATGLVGDQKGAIRRFRYETTASCAGPFCPATFEIEACRSPTVVENESAPSTYACAIAVPLPTPMFITIASSASNTRK